jgi:membrane-bound ClpP family serine protease
VPVALISIGAVLIVFTFLLAFTIYGELSAVVGVACIVIGAVLLGRRSTGRGASQPRRH